MNNWISVDDRTPEVGKDVLCSFRFTDELHILRRWADGQWLRALDDESWDIPTYWQPLPAPPEQTP